MAGPPEQHPRVREVLGGPQSCGEGEAAGQEESLAWRWRLGPVSNVTGKAPLLMLGHQGSVRSPRAGAEGTARAYPCQEGRGAWLGPGPTTCKPAIHGCQAVWVPGPVVSLQVCSCVPTPVQAKDSDDDDDVTVTVDRDRFMDEFFEQVGASTPVSPHTLAGLG